MGEAGSGRRVAARLLSIPGSRAGAASSGLRPPPRADSASRTKDPHQRVAAAAGDKSSGIGSARHRLPSFGAARPAIWLEIGFGGGEHLAQQAEQHPQIGFIGCEVFENGIVKLLAQIERRRLDNIRIFADDARLMIAAMPPASVDRVFILFPDPWPKRRQHKRRIVSRADPRRPGRNHDRRCRIASRDR